MLRQKTEISEPQITEAFSGEAELGQTGQLPDQAPLYARIQFQVSYFGKCSSLIFKGKPLSMTATLTDGQTKQYRIISGMADVGFIVSPLIENTNEFAALFRGLESLAGKKLRSIRVDSDDDFWNIKYRLSLGTLRYDPSLKRTE